MLKLGLKLGAKPRRVPSRAAGKLVFLDEDDIAQAELGQVIQQAAAGNAAADDNDFRFALH